MSPSFESPVIALGAIHYDTIAHGAEVIRPETSTPARFHAKPGGVATNVSRNLSRLGVQTKLIGTVGDDAAAQILKEQLGEEGIEHFTVTRSGFSTGQYLALHDPDGSLKAACVDDRILSEAPADLFSDIVDRLSATADEKTIWFVDANLPAPMLEGLASQIQSGRLMANAVSDAKSRRLKPLLSRLDCLYLNRGEAAALTGLPASAGPDEISSALVDAGLKVFVLTDGPSGIIVSNKGLITRLTPENTDVVDVTGAGDALTAGSLAAVSKGYALEEAVRFGLRAAALTLASTGALAETLSWEALTAF
ncbi:carbohydrate kinase family protein [uncultured Roseibium sp.]|uniref:carbohydrate kinase family protein n=1 Tax=uncultured Roseibium sp. TaxID=1936171 RepID=UPI0026021007|nr:carbohydrate kinase family protein [uncultured Roseibium sp.]